jgi:hypothetical protein
VAKNAEFKPCDRLTPDDFEAYPLWGFDVSMEGSSEGADETWVRPFEYRSLPKASDVLFAAAKLKAGAHPPQDGALTFRVVRARLEVDACVLLQPKYCAISLHLTDTQRSYLQSALGDSFPSYFPIAYETTIRFGKERFPVSGTLVLPQQFK